MKTFNEILKEVDNTYSEIEEIEEMTKELKSTYLNIINLKERHEKRKKVENELVRLEEKKKDLQIAIIILHSNAKIALFNEVMPQALEVLSKYQNKHYGPKTKQKIRDEIMENTNCSFYISERYSSQEYHIIPTGFVVTTYNIECGPKYIGGEYKKILDDNKIQVLEFSDITLRYTSTEYIDDIAKRIEELKKTYRNAYEKQQELDCICKRFNSLVVGDIKHIYSDKRIKGWRV